VRLQRGSCYGACPSYELTIHDDGRVEFMGRARTAISGAQQGRADATALAQLRSDLQQPAFTPLVGTYRNTAPACGTWATDMPTVTVEVWQQSHWQRIEHDWGCSAAPKQLRTLEELIDRAAQSAAWVGGRATE
jgi:hypothetical protein